MGYEDIARHVATNITALRRARGWSGAELARRAGVDAGTVVNVEAGANVTLATLVALAAAFELPLQDVLFDGLADRSRPFEIHRCREREPLELGGWAEATLATVDRARHVALAERRYVEGHEHRTTDHVAGRVERTLVITGSLEVGPLEGDEAPVALAAGDLLTVRADVPRRYRAVGGDAVVVTLATVEGPPAR